MFWPNRMQDISGIELNFENSTKKMYFNNLDFTKYPCLKLAVHAHHTGHAATIVLNAANEIAVSYFLKNKIDFHDIFYLNSQSLNFFKQTNPHDIESTL